MPTPFEHAARIELVLWADRDRTRPASMHIEARKVQQSAILLSEQRKLATVKQAHADAELDHQQSAVAIDADVSRALVGCLLEVADAERDKLRQLIIEADRTQAAVNGIVKWLREHGHAGEAQRLMQPVLTRAQSDDFKSRLTGILAAAYRSAGVLMIDPDAKLEVGQ